MLTLKPGDKAIRLVRSSIGIAIEGRKIKAHIVTVEKVTEAGYAHINERDEVKYKLRDQWPLFAPPRSPLYRITLHENTPENRLAFGVTRS